MSLGSRTWYADADIWNFGNIEARQDGDDRGCASHSFRKASPCFLSIARGLPLSVCQCILIIWTGGGELLFLYILFPYSWFLIRYHWYFEIDRILYFLISLFRYFAPHYSFFCVSFTAFSTLFCFRLYIVNKFPTPQIFEIQFYFTVGVKRRQCRNQSATEMHSWETEWQVQNISF